MSDRDVKITKVSEVIEANWEKAKKDDLAIKTLSVRIGKNETGYVELNIHEKADGPHMLVAGTTGSGKTETIITYLLGLCMKYGPDELNLLLVDMKGGGFTKRIGNLPHVVGQVTDVTGDENGVGAEYMLRRFLYAMTAEIKRRKTLFNKLHVDCIDDYIKRYREIETDGVEEYAKKKNITGGFNFTSIKDVSPLAHLILVVDEFTELKRFSSQNNDVDFISEITTIARVGRSLGFHIILISQNIEGAITDDIRVNSNARLCHKVATAQASKEMIGSALAAAPSMPGNGRAYLMSGNGRRLEYFQAGYSKVDTDEVVPMRIDLVNKTGAYQQFYNSEEDNKDEQENRKKKEENGEYLTQLELITGAISNAYERRKKDYVIHQIFKQPLPEVLTFNDLKTKADTTATGEIMLGLYDDPEDQKQPVFTYNHIRENMIVYGGSGSGKTVLIKSLLLQMHVTDLNEEVYIIDFGGNIGDYRELKKVYGCFDNSNEEDVKRVFQTVRTRMEENAKVLGSENYVSKHEKEASACPRHVMLIIENVNALLEDERYTNYRDDLVTLCRDGLSKGVSVVMTAKELSGLAKLKVHVSKRVAFDMPAENYGDIFSTKVIKPIKKQGRGLADCGNVIREIQAAYFDGKHETNMLKEYKGEPSGRIKAFKEEDFLYNVNAVPAWKTILVGKEYYKQDNVELDLDANKCIAIYGKRKFGKTNLLQLLLLQIEKKYPGKYEYYLMDDGRKQLGEENLKYFYDLFPKVDLCEDQEIRCSELGKAMLYRNKQSMDFVLEATTSEKPKVVILQAREFYNRRSHMNTSNDFVAWVEKELEGGKDILIFSDVKRSSSAIVQDEMKTWFQCAFLLDNIGDFVADKGRGSVFGEMDAKELRTEYANCNVGDGFYYDVEADELKKLRFYKCTDKNVKKDGEQDAMSNL